MNFSGSPKSERLKNFPRQQAILAGKSVITGCECLPRKGVVIPA
jgi:hypothetical protein